MFDSIFQQSEDYRVDYERDWEDAYKMYYGFVDMRLRDPNLLHAFIPRAYSLTETLFPEDVKALMGQKPYFSLDPKLEPWRSNTEAIEKLLDCAADDDNLFSTFALGLKQRRIVGNMFIEPYWRFEVREKAVNAQRKFKGYVIDGGKAKMQYIDEGLSWRLHSPWNVGVDPYVGDIDKMRWFYVKQPLSLQELEQLMKLGKYAKKFEDLHSDGQAEFDTVAQRIEADLGYARARNDSDMGELVRVWIPRSGRYFEFWGGKEAGIHLIREMMNPYPFVPIINFINNYDPFPDRVFGIGEIRPNMQMFAMLNDAYSQLFNSQQQSMDPPTLYPNGWLDPQTLVAAPGQRTPYNPTYADKIQQAIFTLPLKPLDRDAYEVPDRIGKIIDDTSGVSQVDRGQFPDRKELAYTVRKVTEGGDIRSEVKVYIAMEAMRQLAKKSIKVLGDNITQEMIERTLGNEALSYVMRDPDDIPGGYEFRFEGPDVITKKESETQMIMNLYQMTTPDVANRQELYKIMVERLDLLTQDQLKRITTLAQPMMGGQPGQPTEGAAVPVDPNAPPTVPPMPTEQMAGQV